MVRSRVLSLFSSFGGTSRKSSAERKQRSEAPATKSPSSRYDTPSPETPSPRDGSPTKADRRISTRPASTVFSHNPPLLQFEQDTPPELQPIFGYLNSHTNKLYLEGYFLKLNDLDNYGRFCVDRQWVECYAQLIGTVLSLWDAAALEAAGNDVEVPPTFINLADASIKMIENLSTQNETGEQSLKNVLSVCSAGSNRYLFHFDSPQSLTQWAAAIRLAMFENTSLSEAYTGSIIAGKGKNLLSIGSILERNRFKHEDWARVRFGAGTPWRRCWFVITPPDEKELQKAQKSMKKSAYDRTPKLVTGNIKFYETKKTKKVKPIATISDAYSAYAIYPQARELIDQSTLIKIEGTYIMHSQSESKREGFVFIMPEVHPAVSGFEIMLRFLIPTFDTFNLYGRPTRLIAAINHIKSIMFAFPNQERYEYLEINDIASIMETPGSQNWSEAEWRRQLKEATARRMANTSSRASSLSGNKTRFRTSLPARYSNVPVEPPNRNGPLPGYMPGFNQSMDAIAQPIPKNESFAPVQHTRSISDTAGSPVQSIPHASVVVDSPASSGLDVTHNEKAISFNDYSSSESDWNRNSYQPGLEPVAPSQEYGAPAPSLVAAPPAFTHESRAMPSSRPEVSPALMRKASKRMSRGTLAQLAAASGKVSFSDVSTPLERLESHGSHESDVSNRQAANNLWHPVSNIPEVAFTHQPTNQRTNFPEEDAPVPPTHNPDTITALSSKPTKQNIRVDTTRAFKRKPVGHPQPQNPIPQTPGEPSYDDLRHTVDFEALNLVGPRRTNSSIPSPDKKANEEEESVYGDESVTTPDYASTAESVYSKSSAKSVPKPRMGVMKTVGTAPEPKDLVIGDAHYSLNTKPQKSSDIPTVDFGPTMTYLPTTGRPSTSDTLRKFEHQRTNSDATEKQRLSRHLDRPHSRSPSRDEYRRSVLWQPGMTPARPVTPGGGLTPEQFVQQRAAPSPPMNYPHHRTPSGTPPPPRPASGDWTAHSRSQSQMSNHSHSRPRSRGASSMINYNDVSSHLSAREQEHVARMTGSSFFNLSSENKKTPPPVNPMGLVGAIDAREREKNAIKEGMSNQMVQHAIAQRQQHWQQQQMIQPPQNHSYGMQSGQSGIYNIPTASHTWDALNQSYRPEEPRRQSWYNQLPVQASMGPVYEPNQTSQPSQQHPAYSGGGNTMRYYS